MSKATDNAKNWLGGVAHGEAIDRVFLPVLNEHNALEQRLTRLEAAVRMQNELLGAYTHEIRAVMEWCRGERPRYDVATMGKVMEQLLNAPLVAKIQHALAEPQKDTK